MYKLPAIGFYVLVRSLSLPQVAQMVQKVALQKGGEPEFRIIQIGERTFALVSDKNKGLMSDTTGDAHYHLAINCPPHELGRLQRDFKESHVWAFARLCEESEKLGIPLLPRLCFGLIAEQA